MCNLVAKKEPLKVILTDTDDVTISIKNLYEEEPDCEMPKCELQTKNSETWTQYTSQPSVRGGASISDQGDLHLERAGYLPTDEHQLRTICGEVFSREVVIKMKEVI